MGGWPLPRRLHRSIDGQTQGYEGLATWAQSQTALKGSLTPELPGELVKAALETRASPWTHLSPHSWALYWFPMAIVTKDHKLGGFEQTQMHSLVVLDVTSFPGLK